MKIESIPQIRKYQIFRDFTWPPDLAEFRRYNLIWAPNGSGKTTLSNLFRRLQRAESLPAEVGHVRFSIDGRIVEGNSFGSSQHVPIRVFNRDTVERSVLEGTRDQLPPVFYLGDENVEAQKRIQQLNGRASKITNALVLAISQRDLANNVYETFCISSARAIKSLLTAPDSPYNNYDKAKFKAAAGRLSQRQDRSKLLLSDVDRTSQITKKNSTPRATIPAVSNPCELLWKFRQETDKLLKESVTSSAIESLVAEPEVASWVNAGLHLHEGRERCFFCDQPLPPSRVERLAQHFNKAYQQFVAKLDAHESLLIQQIRNISNMVYPSAAELYEDEIVAYKNQLNAVHATNEQCRSYLQSLLEATRKKRVFPFESLDLAHEMGNFVPGNLIISFLAVALEAVQNTFSSNATYELNGLIADHNNRVSKHEQEVSLARKKLEESDIVSGLDEYEAKGEAIELANSRSQRLKSISLSLQAKISKCQEYLRRHQKPGNELTKELAAYLGHDDLTFQVEENGYVIRRGREAATRLSEGEKTAIAILYFLKSLSDSGFEFENGIVVIDDPVSSLDSSSLYCAFGYLQARTVNAGQLFILTHNFTLFRLTKNWFENIRKIEGAPQSSLYMLRTEISDQGRSSHICRLDPLLVEFESDYHYLFKSVVIFARDSVPANLSNCYAIANSSRRLLEGFLAFRVPQTSRNLDGKLQHIEYDTAKKTRLLRFLHVNSHADHISEFEHDPSPLLEARQITLDLLDMMRKEDSKHFDGLCERIGLRGYVPRQ